MYKCSGHFRACCVLPALVLDQFKHNYVIPDYWVRKVAQGYLDDLKEDEL